MPDSVNAISHIPDFKHTNGSVTTTITQTPVSTLNARSDGVVRPCPQICNENGCVCATGTATIPIPTITIAVRDDGVVKPCPQVCDKDGCVCASEVLPAPQKKAKRDDGVVKPCPQV